LAGLSFSLLHSTALFSPDKAFKFHLFFQSTKPDQLTILNSHVRAPIPHINFTVAEDIPFRDYGDRLIVQSSKEIDGISKIVQGDSSYPMLT
jgi:hypothetical protein